MRASQYARRPAGRAVHFEREPDLALRHVRELLVNAMEQQLFPQEPAIVLRVGPAGGRHTAGVDAAAFHDALQLQVADLLTVESMQTALSNLPTDAA